MFIRLRPFSRRTLLFTIIVVTSIIFVLWTYLVPDVKKAKECFRLKEMVGGDGPTVKLFENVLESKRKPTPGKSIFFHETSCSKNGLMILNAR